MNKSDIDDVIDTSQMSGMPQNFPRGSKVSTHRVSSPYKEFNLLAVSIMSEKNTSGYMVGVHSPLLECHGNHLRLN